MIKLSLRLMLQSFLIFSLIILGCEKGKPVKDNPYKDANFEKGKPLKDNPYKDARIEIKTFRTQDGWGYDVYVWDALFIHQPHRPAVPGRHGFETEEDARKVAELVVKKIKEGQIPPTVTIEEMSRLGVLR